MISRSGKAMPGRGREAEPPGVQPVDGIPFDRRPRGRCSSLRRRLSAASSRSIPLIRPRRRAPSICAAAVSGSPASAAHIASTSGTIFGSIFCDAVLQRAQAGRIGVRQRALHADLEHPRREAVDVDAGDDHPRRIGLAHPQQQPGALGGPVDRIHVARRGRARASSALRKRDMRPARRDRRVHRRISAGEKGSAGAAPRVGAEAELDRIEPPDEARVAPCVVRIFDRRRRRLRSCRRAISTTPVSLSPTPSGASRRGGRAVAACRRMAPGTAGGACWPGRVSCASAGRASAAAAAAASRRLARIGRSVDLNLDRVGRHLARPAGKEEHQADATRRTRTIRTITARGICTHVCLGWNATAFAAPPARCIALLVGKLTDRLDRPIVLVGLMGAGKSTVGRRLAKRLGLPFIDTDSAIADAAGYHRGRSVRALRRERISATASVGWSHG